MSLQDCIKLIDDCDPEDAARVRANQEQLVRDGVPPADAWTQAAEIVMDEVLGERNELAAEIRDKGGYLEDLTLENLLNPASIEGVREPKPEYKSTRPKGKYHKGQKRDVKLQDEIPGLKRIWRYLTEAEKKKLRRDSAQRLVDMWQKMPDPAEMASVAYAGRAKRGWYENSARAIIEIFGVEDAPRFAALLAAMSPQTSVEDNLINALNVWSNWINYGGIARELKSRPTDPKVILEIMGKSVKGKRGVDSVLGAWRNNSIRALTAEFPENLVLSGPKVNSFMLNLRNEVNEVTNDTWMANYALLTDKTTFGGALTKGGDPGKGADYLAMSATVRQAADIISRRTGENWTPAEVQETVWSWAKAAYEKRAGYDENRSVLQLVDDADIHHEEIVDVPDFERLFVQEFYAQILGKPYADAIEEIRRANASGTRRYRRVRATGPTTSPEGAGIAEDAFRTHLRQAAKRLDKLKEIRSRKVVDEKAEVEAAEASERGQIWDLEEGPEYEVPTEPREADRTVRQDESPQRDLFTDTAISGEKAQEQAADTFGVVFEEREVSTFNSGVTKITTSAEAAHLFAHIRKYGQETFMVGITDDDGNILKVIRHSIGTRDSASVYPIDIVGAIAATEGGTGYWLAHNHPSGQADPSGADLRITETIKNATTGMPVLYRGHVVIGDQVFSDVEVTQVRPIPPFPRRKKVAISERKLKRRINRDAQPISRPVQAKQIVRELESESGLLLLDNRNRPVGVINLTTAQMKKLRDNKQVRRILAAIDTTNANAIIAFNKQDGGREALENLGRYLGNLNSFASVRTIDGIFVDDYGNMGALADEGVEFAKEPGGFALRKGAEKIQQRGHRRRVNKWLKKPLRRLSKRVPVNVVNNETDVNFEVEPGTAGYKYNGQIYLFRDYIRDENEAIEAVEHEAIGHLGIEGVLGKKKFDELLGDIMNIKVEIMLDKSGKLHPKVRAIQAQLRQNYVDAEGNYMLDAREEAREIIAHIAHSKPRLGRLREIYNKIVAWVKQWAASMGMADPDMAHIESLLVRATDYITDQDMEIQPDTEKGAAMRRVRPPEREPEQDEQQTETERDMYSKLGLDGQETVGLWRALSNLRFSGIKQALKEANARGYEGLFDGLIEIKRKEIEAGKGLGKEVTYLTPKGIEKKTVDYENSAYVAARLATGVSDMMTHILHWGALQWEGGVIQPVENTRGFLDMMKELGPDNLNDWLLWMGSHRADMLMRQGREKNLTRAEIDEGMAIAGPRGSERYQLFEKIKNEYAALNRLQLDLAEGAGLIDPVKRAEWDTDWYVPFYRQTDDERVLGPNTKRGLSHQSAGIRALRGGKIPTADLMQNILQNWIKLTDASVKNHALKTMMDNFKDTDYISNETAQFRKALVPETELHRYIKENRVFAARLAEWLSLDPKTTADGIWDAVADLSKDKLEEVWQVVAPTDPDVVRVQRNGKNEYYRIHVPGLLRATGHMQPRDWQSSRGMRAGRWFKQILTVGVTASPDFMMRNFIRDAAHSWAINKDNMWFLKDSMAGLMEAKDEGPIHRAMMAAGASFQGGYVHGTDPEATKNILRRELTKAGMNKATIEKYIGSIHFTNGQIERRAGKWWQMYRDAGDRIENASRVATAKAGRDAGKPDAQWLFESKDLMDYSRRGNFAALIFLTDVMPFLNARLQGLDKLGRAWRTDPGIVTKKVAMIAAFSVFLAMLNDDDDDYQQLPDWEKDAYWHVFFQVGDEKEHIRIPKPFELGFVAGTMPERMYRAWYTQSQPDEKVLWALQHGIRETLNIQLYPQFMLPIAELKANRHFYFDQPIESIADKNVVPKERYNQYTSETAVLMAEGLDNPLTRWLEMSPKQLQHLWNGYTGTMGAYALSMADRITGPAAGFPKPEETQIEDWALIKSLYKGQRKRTTQWQIDVYDRIQEVNQLYGTLQKYRREGNLEKYTAFRAENYEKLKVRRRLTRAQKNFSTLRKQRERILKDDRLTAQQKYEQSQAIQARINEYAKRIEAATREGF